MTTTWAIPRSFSALDKAAPLTELARPGVQITGINGHESTSIVSAVAGLKGLT